MLPICFKIYLFSIGKKVVESAMYNLSEYRIHSKRILFVNHGIDEIDRCTTTNNKLRLNFPTSSKIKFSALFYPAQERIKIRKTYIKIIKYKYFAN